MLYDFLLEKYGQNEPIFLTEIEINGVSNANIRQQMKKLLEQEKVQKFDTGIYFIPQESVFRSGSQLSLERVIEQKYLREKERLCGYMTGLMFANQMGVTTQVPAAYEIVSNKATTRLREVSLAKSRVIIRQPKVPVDGENVLLLQFLDFLKDIDIFSEMSGEALTKQLLKYMKNADITFEKLKKYFPYYPDKIYKNMYETGLLNEVSA